LFKKYTVCIIGKSNEQEPKYGIVIDRIWMGEEIGFVYNMLLEDGNIVKYNANEVTETDDQTLPTKLIEYLEIYNPGRTKKAQPRQNKVTTTNRLSNPASPINLSAASLEIENKLSADKWLETFIKLQPVEVNWDILNSLINTPRKLKKNWETIKTIIDANNIKHLYHFTDRSNLESINKHKGLYSWYTAAKAGIQIARPGGNNLSRDLDVHKGLEDYVRLSFSPNQPMKFKAIYEGRIIDPIELLIDPQVIYWQDTLFCDQNANDNEACIGRNLEDIKKIKFDLVKKRYENKEERKFYMAEILVKSYLSIQYIKNI